MGQRRDRTLFVRLTRPSYIFMGSSSFLDLPLWCQSYSIKRGSYCFSGAAAVHSLVHIRSISTVLCFIGFHRVWYERNRFTILNGNFNKFHLVYEEQTKKEEHINLTLHFKLQTFLCRRTDFNMSYHGELYSVSH